MFLINCPESSLLEFYILLKIVSSLLLRNLVYLLQKALGPETSIWMFPDEA